MFRVIVPVCNHYSGQQRALFCIKKTNSITIGLQLYNLWQIYGHQLNCRIANSKTPLFYLGL